MNSKLLLRLRLDLGTPSLDTPSTQGWIHSDWVPPFAAHQLSQDFFWPKLSCRTQYGLSLILSTNSQLPPSKYSLHGARLAKLARVQKVHRYLITHKNLLGKIWIRFLREATQMLLQIIDGSRQPFLCTA